MTQALLKRRPLSTLEYDAMFQMGILAEDERVELIDGEIIEMTPIGGPQAWSVGRLNRLLMSAIVGKDVEVWVQSPFHLSASSEPVPDLMLFNSAPQLGSSLPDAADLLLIIEVSDSSLMTDRKIKLPLYAAAGIPEVWIVNLVEKVVEVYRAPKEHGYSASSRIAPGEKFSPEALPAVVLNASDIFG